jgi:transcriptional regulator of arginine metabolism
MSNMLTKTLISLLEKGIKNQDQLKNELEKLGYTISQSNLSRKLKKIGAVRIDGVYQISKPSSHRKNNIILYFVKPNMIVIKCEPGMASSIAIKIDQILVNNSSYPEFVGCIAGDDTIFIAVSLDNQNESLALKKIMEII